MKLRFLICVLMASILLLGCGSAPIQGSELTTEPKNTSNVRVFYPQEQAMTDGWLVVQDGDVRHNQDKWMEFLYLTEDGKTSEITVVHYVRDEQQGTLCRRYDLSFDGESYLLKYEEDGIPVNKNAFQLVFEFGTLGADMDPYDRYERYLLDGIALYVDLIAEPDYTGVTKISLHEKEGDPPVESYVQTDAVERILSLLSKAEYVPCPPREYCYGMKLIMTNGYGQELVIELDLLKGVYRYGQQHYEYGAVEDIMEVLGIDQWPQDVLAEFGLS